LEQNRKKEATVKKKKFGLYDNESSLSSFIVIGKKCLILIADIQLEKKVDPKSS